LTGDDLVDADLVIALPVHDYPSAHRSPAPYDEEWTSAELDILEEYVLEGGRLVLTNSARRLKYFNLAFEHNEDWSDQNALAERFGVHYLGYGFIASTARVIDGHPLVRGVERLDLADLNSRVFQAPDAEVLVEIAGSPAVAVATVGSGEVIVLADVGILGSSGGDPANLRFWQNLALYAR
jgi:hypothetical protein